MSPAAAAKRHRRHHKNRTIRSTSLILGRSVEGRTIHAHCFPRGSSKTILILGGFHGDEPKSVYVAQRLIEALTCSPTEIPASALIKGGLKGIPASPLNKGGPTGISASPLNKGGSRGVLQDAECTNILADASFVIVPIVNPDGYERRKRRNANGVDLNRNFPTKNWTLGDPRSRMFGGVRPASEPETRAVIRAVERFSPSCIITIHSIDRNRFCNNYDGPGRRIAEAMHRFNRYPVTASIGYPTPGSFGTWAGAERKIPTITLELPSHHSAKRCWQDNRDAIFDAARVPATTAPPGRR